jgi:hypothetical protein
VVVRGRFLVRPVWRAFGHLKPFDER